MPGMDAVEVADRHHVGPPVITDPPHRRRPCREPSAPRAGSWVQGEQSPCRTDHGGETGQITLQRVSRRRPWLGRRALDRVEAAPSRHAGVIHAPGSMAATSRSGPTPTSSSVKGPTQRHEMAADAEVVAEVACERARRGRALDVDLDVQHAGASAATAGAAVPASEGGALGDAPGRRSRTSSPEMTRLYDRTPFTLMADTELGVWSISPTQRAATARTASASRSVTPTADVASPSASSVLVSWPSRTVAR